MDNELFADYNAICETFAEKTTILDNSYTEIVDTLMNNYYSNGKYEDDDVFGYGQQFIVAVYKE